MGSKSEDLGTSARTSQQAFNPMSLATAFEDPEFRASLKRMIAAFVEPDRPESGPWANRTWADRNAGLTKNQLAQWRARDEGEPIDRLPTDDTQSKDDADRRQSYGLERVLVRNQNINRPTPTI